jgi:YgiT-type zinc finger domain-containing protein
MNTLPEPLCPTCHIGKLRLQTVTYTQVLAGHLFVIPNTPALVCDICGERVLDNEVLSRLSGLLGPGQQGMQPLTHRF